MVVIVMMKYVQKLASYVVIILKPKYHNLKSFSLMVFNTTPLSTIFQLYRDGKKVLNII